MGSSLILGAEYGFCKKISVVYDFGIAMQLWKIGILTISFITGGGGFYHSKGTWGCAARKSILFRTSSLAKGILFGNFSQV